MTVGLVVAWSFLRHNQRPADLGPANGISRDTVDRWVRQTLTTLARMPPASMGRRWAIGVIHIVHWRTVVGGWVVALTDPAE
jgi:hypothetical protein